MTSVRVDNSLRDFLTLIDFDEIFRGFEVPENLIMRLTTTQ
jgi:hypothetical protein